MVMKHKKAPRLLKNAFVRRHPKLKAGELVNLAKEKGLTLTAKYVYNVRAQDKVRNVATSKPASEATMKKRVKIAKNKLDELMTGKPVHVRIKDLDLDPSVNVRAEPSILDQVRASGNMNPVRLHGEGVVKAFKAMVLALGTEQSRRLIIEVEDAVSSAIGRPPLG